MKYRMYTNDWRRYDRGYRSSIAVSGVLTHPELEVLPLTNPPFRPDQAAPIRDFSAENTLRQKEDQQQHRKKSLFSGFQFRTAFEDEDMEDEEYDMMREIKLRKPIPKLEIEEEHISPLDHGREDLAPAQRLLSVARPHSALLHPDDARARRVSTSADTAAAAPLTQPGVSPKSSHGSFRSARETAVADNATTVSAEPRKMDSIASFRTAWEKPFTADDSRDVSTGDNIFNFKGFGAPGVTVTSSFVFEE